MPSTAVLATEVPATPESWSVGRIPVWVRAGLAVVATLVGGFVGWAVCVVGTGQYLEDYCFTAVEPLAGGSRGPFFDLPATVRCDFSNGGVLTVTDWRPLLFMATVAGVTLTMIGLVWWGLVVRPGPRSVSAGTNRS